MLRGICWKKIQVSTICIMPCIHAESITLFKNHILIRNQHSLRAQRHPMIYHVASVSLRLRYKYQTVLFKAFSFRHFFLLFHYNCQPYLYHFISPFHFSYIKMWMIPARGGMKRHLSFTETLLFKETEVFPIFSTFSFFHWNKKSRRKNRNLIFNKKFLTFR